jgi:hypothetical protein
MATNGKFKKPPTRMFGCRLTEQEHSDLERLTISRNKTKTELMRGWIAGGVARLPEGGKS